MNFNFQRQIRLAGTVLVLVGVFARNISIGIIGWSIVAIGYMWTISKIELGLEEQTKKKGD